MARPSIVDLDTWGATRWAAARDDREPIRRYMARIVTAATTNRAGLEVVTAIRCRRRPDGRRCGGHLVVRRQDLPQVILWWCDHCTDGGVVRNWRDTPLDLGAPGARAHELIVELPEHVYRTLERSRALDGQALRVVLGAWHADDAVVLHGAREALDALRWMTLGCADRAGASPRARHFLHAASVLRRGLARYRPVRA